MAGRAIGLITDAATQLDALTSRADKLVHTGIDRDHPLLP